MEFPRPSKQWDKGRYWRAVARSIQAWSDPAQQLALYEALYEEYTALYNQLCKAGARFQRCANLTLPSALTNPSALQNASLDVIQNAIQSISSQGPNLAKVMPPVPVPEVKRHRRKRSSGVQC